MSEVTYEPLAKTFRKHDSDFTMIARQSDVAMFARKSATMTAFEYEVVIVKRRKAREVFGESIPAQESMPSDSEWGKLGWGTNSWSRAWEIFEREVAKRGFQQSPLWETGEMDRFSKSIRP